MRQETIVKTYLKFEELNEEQKKKVLDNYRSINVDFHDWHDYTLEEFKGILELLGFVNPKIYYRGFWSQGDGACFVGKFKMPIDKDDLKNRVKKVKEEYPFVIERTNNLFDFENLNFDKDYDEKFDEIYHRGHYFHENSIYCHNEELLEFCKYFSQEIYSSLSNEYDYLTSDEAIKETILSNDYEFDIDTLKIA